MTILSLIVLFFSEAHTGRDPYITHMEPSRIAWNLTSVRGRLLLKTFGANITLVSQRDEIVVISVNSKTHEVRRGLVLIGEEVLRQEEQDHA